MRHLMCSAIFACCALGCAAQTFPYDHIHVNVPDPAAGFCNYLETSQPVKDAPPIREMIRGKPIRTTAL